MRVTYDPEADALYIQLRQAPVATTREIVEATMMLDLDDQEQPIGIELPFVSRLEGVDPLALAFQVLGRPPVVPAAA